MSCKKVKFSTEKYANEYIYKLKTTSKRAVVPTRSYLCPECLTWHLTSSQEEDKERQINNLKIALEKKRKQCDNLTKEVHELKYKLGINKI